MDRILSSGVVTECITPFQPMTAPIPLVRMAALALTNLKMTQDLTAYSELTESWAVAAVQAKLGGADKVAEIEAALQAQIDVQRTPVTGSGVPW